MDVFECLDKNSKELKYPNIYGKYGKHRKLKLDVRNDSRMS